jgi:2'-5' RNA ligase
MKRIFIAVKIEPGEILLKMISSFKTGLSNENIKWTNTDNIHITLSFLGDTEESQIIAINEILMVKCEGFGQFDLVLKGTGVFKSQGDPRVIWAGIEPPQTHPPKLAEPDLIVSVGGVLHLPRKAPPTLHGDDLFHDCALQG